MVVFQREDAGKGSIMEILRELAPLEEKDLLAEDGAGRALIIKEGAETGEIEEFAMALIGTLLLVRLIRSVENQYKNA